LDNKPQLANLFSDFWTPLFTELKKVNPSLQFTAEQANWFSYGFEYFDKGNVDRVFAFGLQMAIASFDKNKIAEDCSFHFQRNTGLAKAQVVFIENHDMKRFASAVNNNPDKEKIGAALNLLLGGIPSIYYGQELGMFGSGGFSKFNKPMAMTFRNAKRLNGAGQIAAKAWPCGIKIQDRGGTAPI
jgi:glycosidase